MQVSGPWWAAAIAWMIFLGGCSFWLIVLLAMIAWGFYPMVVWVLRRLRRG